MEKVGDFFYNLVSKYSWAIILIILAGTIFFGYGLSKLKMASEFTDDLPANDPIIRAQRYFQEVFGKKEFLVIGVENPKGIYNPSTLQKVKAISEELKNIPCVIEDEILGLSTANNIKGREWGLEVGRFMKEVPQTEEELNQLRDDVRGNDMFFGRLVSKDETMTTIIANMLTDSIQGADLDKAMTQVYALTKRFEGPEKFYFNGNPMGSYEIDLGIKNDINRLIPLAFILILVEFFIAFRRLRGVLIPTIVMAVSIIWTMGLMGFLGYKINVVTSVIPVVMLAITSSYGIHILFRYYEMTGARGFSSGQNPAALAAKRLSSSLLMAGGTSAIGSVTLMVFKVVSIKEFGIFLSFGIVIGFLLALTLAPAILFLLKPQGNNVSADESEKGDIFDRLIGWMIKLVLGNRMLISFIIGFVLLISFVGIYKIKVGLNFIDFFPSGHSFTVASYKFNAQAGGTNPIIIMVEAPEADGIKNPLLLKQMLSLEAYTRTLPDVGNTDSFARLIKRMHYVMNGEEKEFDIIPESEELIAQYLLLYSISGNPGDFDNLVDYEYRRAKITINLTTFDQERQKEIFEGIQKYIAKNFPPEIKTAYEGLPYWIAQTNYVVKGKIQNIISSILIIFLFCTIAYRSFRFGIFSVIPLTIVTLFTFGLMGFLGIRLNMATAIITSIAVGVGVDFSIHFLTHFREELLKGCDYRAAIAATLTSTGKVIILDGLSNILGFVMFIGSDFVPVKNLGWLLSMNMITVSSATLIILPVILSFFDLSQLTANLTLEKGEAMLRRTKIRWGIVSAGLVLWFLFTFNFAFSAEMSAREIMDRNDAIQISRDNFSKITMKLINEKGQERVRKIFFWEKTDQERNRSTLAKFQFPADVKGSGLLTLEYKDKEDDQWLYLPAMHKTRRISASDKGDSFMGSDFTFEDMELDKLDEFEFRLIGSLEFEGEACYKIEGFPKGNVKKNYSKREFLVRKSDFSMKRIVFFDKKGAFLKTFTASDFSVINGKPRAHKIVMENPQKKHKTELIYEEIRLDQGFPGDPFTERELIKE